MAEIISPRIESIADPGTGPQDQSAHKPRVKAAVAGEPASPNTPEISAPEEEEKHELDEMA
ncbi:MAG: hypothetical protein LAN18_05910 [Acidobacteriia bacterium]|nr:hypothetical protein [Terriglobia bacterium]